MYDKSGKMLGFVKLGDVNDVLMRLEQQINENQLNSEKLTSATFDLIVKRLFFKLHFLIMHFHVIKCLLTRL